MTAHRRRFRPTYGRGRSRAHKTAHLSYAAPLIDPPTARHTNEHGRKSLYLTYCEAMRTLRALRIADRQGLFCPTHEVYACRWATDPRLGDHGGTVHWHIGRPPAP